jgi:hypothetical protein
MSFSTTLKEFLVLNNPVLTCYMLCPNFTSLHKREIHYVKLANLELFVLHP